MVIIQEKAFCIEQLMLDFYSSSDLSVGGVATFTGLVREFDRLQQSPLAFLEIEHYPGMTEAALLKIEAMVKEKFQRCSLLIVHRVGKLKVGEQIVFVAATSEHRQAAFDAVQMSMDLLKNDAPFWKKEHRLDGSSRWIEQKQTDVDAIHKWTSSTQKKTAD